jgi:hypothetical protein
MARGRAVTSSEVEARPYRPSWLDGLQAWIDRSSPSPYLVYALAWALHFSLVTAIKWWDGSVPVGTVFPFHGATWGTAMLALALMHHLDRVAVAAVDDFRPLLQAGDATIEGLRYRLTHLPRRWTLAAAGFGVAIAALQLPGIYADPAVTGPMRLGTSRLATGVEVASYLATWIVLVTLAYHTKHQLSEVHRILAHHTHVNPYRLDPLYRFSWLTARTAIGIVAVPLLHLWTSATLIELHAEWVLVTLGFAGLAVAAFVWPLWEVHRLLDRDKHARLQASGLRLEAAYARLHTCAEHDDLATVDAHHKLIAGLAMERADLERLSTWPWRPETPRLLFTAVLLPTAVFVVQRVLATRLGL